MFTVDGSDGKIKEFGFGLYTVPEGHSVKIRPREEDRNCSEFCTEGQA